MASHSRHTTSPAPSPSQNTSKLPRFLQKQANRDRSASRSGVDPGPSSSSTTTSNAMSSEANPVTKPRKTSKFLSINKEDKSKKSSDIPTPQPSTPPTAVPPTGGPINNYSDTADEAPVIVEPVSIPRPRTRSERPASSAPESHYISPPVLFSSASSTSRIGDLPTRLSGWFHHTFSTSSTDLSTLLAQQATSPKGKGPNALLTAAKHGKGHLDKAMRYLLDSDATPDKCLDPIWLLGVEHPGYESPPPSHAPSTGTAEKKRRGSASPPVSFRSSTSSATPDSSLSQSTSSIPSNKHVTKHDPSANWPPVFYLDFTSRIWLTYRAQFPIPIKDGRLADLCGDGCELAAVAAAPSTGTPSMSKRAWPWSGEKTWSTDSGWGCMLRTGQSLLANTLVHVHLGRGSLRFLSVDFLSPHGIFRLAASATSSAHCGLCHLCANFDVVPRYPVT
jgi:cysteine protease ATG4